MQQRLIRLHLIEKSMAEEETACVREYAVPPDHLLAYMRDRAFSNIVAAGFHVPCCS